MDQDRLVYIVVDKVGAPYRVLLYQPGIRFSLGTNSKVSSLQQVGATSSPKSLLFPHVLNLMYYTLLHSELVYIA